MQHCKCGIRKCGIRKCGIRKCGICKCTLLRPACDIKGAYINNVLALTFHTFEAMLWIGNILKPLFLCVVLSFEMCIKFILVHYADGSYTHSPVDS